MLLRPAFAPVAGSGCDDGSRIQVETGLSGVKVRASVVRAQASSDAGAGHCAEVHGVSGEPEETSN